MSATNTPATGHGVDPAFADEFGQKVIGAWNSHQPDQLLELLTDDVVYDDSGWPKQMRGHTDVREFLESNWRAAPDLTFEIVEGSLVDPAAPRTAHHWHATATDTGVWDPPGLAPTGRPMSFDGAAFYELRDGKACRVRVVYDVASILRQMGVLPQTGSPGERIMTTTANVMTRIRSRLTHTSGA